MAIEAVKEGMSQSLLGTQWLDILNVNGNYCKMKFEL